MSLKILENSKKMCYKKNKNYFISRKLKKYLVFILISLYRYNRQ